MLHPFPLPFPSYHPTRTLPHLRYKHLTVEHLWAVSILVQFVNNLLLFLDVPPELVETLTVQFGSDCVVGLHQTRLLRRSQAKLDYSVSDS